MNKRVLCIGFQEDFSVKLKEKFSTDGIEVFFEASTIDAMNILKQREFDLLFLRIDATNTVELIRTIKGIRSMTGSLLIFAAQDEQNAAAALEAGADAILPAKASPDLTYRQTLAVFRRQHLGKHEDQQAAKIGRFLRFRDIVIDHVLHQVTREGTPLELNRREYRLLTCLAEHPDTAITTEKISQAVWQSENTYGRDLTPIVASLRRKLGSCRNGSEYIKTVWGVGYRIISGL